METHSSTLAWKIPWMEEPGRLQSMGWQRVGREWVTLLSLLLLLGIGMKTDLFQSCGHCWVFQICWHIECSTFTASSFRIWNSWTGIPPPPLALFVVMLSKAHLTSHSRMSGSSWVITPSWLFGLQLVTSFLSNSLKALIMEQSLMVSHQSHQYFNILFSRCLPNVYFLLLPALCLVVMRKSFLYFKKAPLITVQACAQHIPFKC